MTQFLKTEKDIEAWLNSYKITDYILVPDNNYGFVVDVTEDVNLAHANLTKLEVKFRRVKKDFICMFNHLKSLKGCPEHVGGSFSVADNQLTTLEYAPQSVNGSFECSYNQIKNLEHSPSFIGKNYFAKQNELVSLKGLPQRINGTLDCTTNNLKSLEYAPRHIEGDFNCSYNLLPSLEYCPKKIMGQFHAIDCRLENLLYFPEFVKEQVYLGSNPLLKETQSLHDFSALYEIHKALKEQKLLYQEIQSKKDFMAKNFKI